MIDVMGISAWEVGPDCFPHFARDLAYNLLTPLLMFERSAQAVMPNGSLGSRGFGDPRPGIVPVDLEARQIAAEIVLHELRRKHVVASRDGRMRRKMVPAATASPVAKSSLFPP